MSGPVDRIRRWGVRLTDRLWWEPRCSLAFMYGAGTFVTVIVVGLIWWAVDPLQQACSHTVCSVDTSVAASVIVAAAAYLAFLVRTRFWLLRGYLREVRRQPENVVWDAGRGPRLAEIARRTELCHAVSEELHADGEHVPLVAGDIGAGKTTFVSALASYLAYRGVVPIYVPMRNQQPPFDVRALARDAFIGEVNDRLTSDAAGDRLWRQIWKRRLVVILADGLDEAFAGGGIIHPSELAPNLTRKGRRAPGQLVVTSRPERVGLTSDYSVFPLEPLGFKESMALVQSRADVLSQMTTVAAKRDLLDAADDIRRRADEIVVALGIPSNPFFLHVVTEMIRFGHPARVLAALDGVHATNRRASQDQARCRLLDAYLVASLARIGETDLGPSGARERLASAARLAYEMTRVGALAFERVGSRLHPIEDNEGEDGRQAGTASASWVADARRLGLLAGGASGQAEMRFSHPMVQAYLTSTVLGDASDNKKTPRWRELMESKQTDEMLTALQLFAGSASTLGATDGLGGVAGEVCDALLDRAKRDSGSGKRVEALGFAAAALRAAASDGRVAVACHVFAALGGVWEAGARTSPSDVLKERANRMEVVKALGDLARATGDRGVRKAAYQLLWKLGRGQPYAVAWQLVEVFADSAGEGFDAIHGAVQTDLRHGLAVAPEKLDQREFIPRISTLAKFLPSLVATYKPDDPSRETPSKALDTLVQVVERMTAKEIGIGAEASLAQGFKYAAERPSASAFDEQLYALAGGESQSMSQPARFWYSRINALQALARRAIADSGRPGVDFEEIERRLLACVRPDEHRFVACAATLGAKAVRLASQGRPDDAKRLVWDDDALEVTRSGAHLDAEAARLLADIVLVLNMNEKSRWDGVRHELVRHRWKVMSGLDLVGTANELPACLESGEQRKLILADEDRCTCKFRLCPYDPHVEYGHAHRTFSPAFCRHQRRLTRNGALPWQQDRALPRQQDLAAKELDVFWEEMERRANARDAYPPHQVR